jgi:hypothetical protein
MVVEAASSQMTSSSDNENAAGRRHVVVLHKLLDDQYQAVENYCNAQTALFNAIHSREPPQLPSARRREGSAAVSSDRGAPAVDEALRSHGDAITALHRNLRSLREVRSKLPRNWRDIVSDHTDRMDHILAWLGGQEPLAHPNGVPCRAEISTDAFTLALTSTRASIRVVKDAVPKP